MLPGHLSRLKSNVSFTSQFPIEQNMYIYFAYELFSLMECSQNTNYTTWLQSHRYRQAGTLYICSKYIYDLYWELRNIIQEKKNYPRAMRNFFKSLFIFVLLYIWKFREIFYLNRIKLFRRLMDCFCSFWWVDTCYEKFRVRYEFAHSWYRTFVLYWRNFVYLYKFFQRESIICNY